MIKMRRNLLLASVAIVSIGIAAPQAYAADSQASGAQSTPSANASADTAESDVIVVTAEKRETKLVDTPISISVLGGKQLDQSTNVGLTQILNSVPGVAATVDYQSGGTLFSVRGVSAAGAVFDGAGTVAYYLDGVPFGLVRSAIGPDLNPYDLARVEVLSGPQGTLYGAGGLNGVVRVLTSDPNLSSIDFKARADVSGTYHGQGANYGGDAELNLPIVQDKLAIRGVIGRHHYAGWIDSDFAKGVNDADIENYRVKVEAKPTDELTAMFSFWRTSNKYGAPSDGDSNYYNKQALPSPMTNWYNAFGFRLAYDGPGFTVTSESSYLKYKSTAFTDLHPLGLPAGFQGVTNLDSRVYTEELDIASSGTGPFKWSGGFFYRDARDHILQPFNTPTASLNYDDFADASKSWAAYAQLGTKFADDKLEVTAGLRYFHDAGLSQALSPSNLGPVSLEPFKASFNAVTPRFVLQWYPNPATSLYASYSQGFRSGIVQDEEVTVVAPDIAAASPDRLHNFEVGAKGNVSRTLDYTAAVFYIKWDNVQQQLQIPINASQSVYAGAIVNGKSASGFGAEATINAHLTDRLTVGGTASYNDLKLDEAIYSGGVLLFEKGQRLNYSPEYTLGGNASYHFPLGGDGWTGRFSGSVNYTSHQQNTTLRGTTRTVKVGDNMFSLNARLEVMNAGGHLNLAVFGNNLSNNNGVPIRAGSSLYFDARVQPRTIGLQLEYHY